MKTFVFVLNGRYEACYCSAYGNNTAKNLKQAETDMGAACVAAFASHEEAEAFCKLINGDK